MWTWGGVNFGENLPTPTRMKVGTGKKIVAGEKFFVLLRGDDAWDDACDGWQMMAL